MLLSFDSNSLAISFISEDCTHVMVKHIGVPVVHLKISQARVHRQPITDQIKVLFRLTMFVDFENVKVENLGA